MAEIGGVDKLSPASILSVECQDKHAVLGHYVQGGCWSNVNPEWPCSKTTRKFHHFLRELYYGGRCPSYTMLCRHNYLDTLANCTFSHFFLSFH